MEKTDLTKVYKGYYTAKEQPNIAVIEPAQFLSLVGQGDPSGQEFADDIKRMYSTAYAIKFDCKEIGKDFVVAKLEAQWWFDMNKYKDITMATAPSRIPRSEWNYRMLIRMPDFVKASMVKKGIDKVRRKGQLINLDKLELFNLNEGKCVQILHIGPFSTEPVSLQKLSNLMIAHKLEHNGLHHEIYLSDFRKTPPEKLKTILREPVK